MGHRGSTWCWSWSMSPATRCAILLRDKLRCVWCRKKLDPKATHESGLKPQLDHFVPRAQGGTHVTTNLVTSCGDCNQEGEEARTPQGYARAEKSRRRGLDREAGRKLAKEVYPWAVDAGKKSAERSRRWRDRIKAEKQERLAALEDAPF